MIIFAIILGIGVGWLAWRRPQWGGLAVFALLPVYQLRFAVFGLPSTVLEVAVLAVVFGSGVHWLQRQSPWPKFSNTLYWVVGLWVLIGLGSVFVATDRLQALGLFRAYIVEPVLLVPVWVALARDSGARKMFVHVASAQLILFAIVALGQRFGVFTSLAPWNAENPARMTSIFPYPNAAALYAAPLTALIAGAILAFRGQLQRWERALWIIGTFSGVVVCALVVSRGAVLGLALAAVVAGAWSARRWVWWGACAAVMITLLVVPSTRMQLSRIVSTQDTSTDVRTVLWQGTWRLLQARPLQGAGLGAFPEVYNRYRLPQHVELLQYPHNLLLNVWVEFGIAGALFSIAALFWLSVRLFRTLRRKEPWALGALLAWIVLVAHGMVDVPFFKNDLAVLTVMLATLTLFFPAPESKIPPA